jgi:hypothetical protein
MKRKRKKRPQKLQKGPPKPSTTTFRSSQAAAANLEKAWTDVCYLSVFVASQYQIPEYILADMLRQRAREIDELAGRSIVEMFARRRPKVKRL